MADTIRNYRIKDNLLKGSLLNGFEWEEGGRLVCIPQEERHTLFIRAIDGMEEGATWGRLRFTYEVREQMVLTVYVLASDDKELEKHLLNSEISAEAKRNFLEGENAIKAVNKTDLLLYGQNGRYLYIAFDLLGQEEATISGIRVNNKGDICMEAFPEVYQEHGSFFHRYLSIYSSMYIDLQEEIRDVYQLLDVETAPKEMLPVLAHWMGIDVSGDFLEEARLRTLVKEAYQLKRMKGTRAVLERLTEIILDEKAIILEKNVVREYSQTEDFEIYKNLYGDRPYDVTMLIRTYVPESQKSQMMFLINQFKPVRCRLFIYFLDGQEEMDSHVYMDMNARTQDEVLSAGMDERLSMDDVVTLQD